MSGASYAGTEGLTGHGKENIVCGDQKTAAVLSISERTAGSGDRPYLFAGTQQPDERDGVTDPAGSQ